ncbi:GNAT family N-acetyltransferase [Achromobacter spanius]|uniref:GNAT family N-acetyltransferase n=1 Tax=Achromobacter spanius TaxID=217203 RepID=UPI0037F6E0F8
MIKHIGGKKDLLIVERDDAYFHRVICELGLVIGAFSGSDLVGYSSLRYPQPGEENFGEYVNLPATEFPFLAHSNGSMVAPDCRGIGLHRRMASARADAARQLGLRHLLSEVHGSNPPSLRNLFSLGFKVRGTKHEDEDDFLIFHHELCSDAIRFKFEVSVPATENSLQQELLLTGLVGYDLEQISGIWNIKYGHPLK